VLRADTATRAGERDRYLDFLRGFSLVVVVLWHWVFSVVTWGSDGPHASNPIGTTRGLWAATWVLQVMPVFFFVGGYAHLRTWRSVTEKGGGVATFYARRLARLAGPAALLLALAAVLWVILRITVPDTTWTTRGVILILSPLWFLCIYVVLVLLTPPAVWLHERFGEIVLVVGIGAAVWIDLLRFRFDHPSWAWANMVIVWGVVHQAGFSWERLIAAPPRSRWCIVWAGLIGLTALTNMGLYPRSMVGVPGETFSNMGPPTLCIVALAAFQIGIVLVARERMSAWLEQPGPARFCDWTSRWSLPLFLWHVPAYAIVYAVVRLAGYDVPEVANWEWWAQRPVWLILPALVCWPLAAAAGRFAR